VQRPIVLGVLLLASLLAGGSGAQAANVECRGVLTGHIDGDAVVPPNETCIIQSATVTGKIVVNGGRLIVQSSNVHGKIVGREGILIRLQGVNVGRELQLEGQQARSHEIESSTIHGDATCRVEAGTCSFSNTSLERDLICRGTSCDVESGSVGGRFECDDVQTCRALDTSVGGTLECSRFDFCTTLDVSVGGSAVCRDGGRCEFSEVLAPSGSMLCARLDVCIGTRSAVARSVFARSVGVLVRVEEVTTGDSVVIGSSGSETAPLDSVDIFDNTIGRDLTVSRNVVGRDIFHVAGNYVGGEATINRNMSSFFDIFGNRVGEDLDFSHNMGPSQITGNVIGRALITRHNEPPPVCAGNTAMEFRGQCFS